MDRTAEVEIGTVDVEIVDVEAAAESDRTVLDGDVVGDCGDVGIGECRTVESEGGIAVEVGEGRAVARPSVELEPVIGIGIEIGESEVDGVDVEG